MSGRSDADKNTFIGDIITALKGNPALLTVGDSAVPGSGWDPTQRITALKSGQTAVSDQETTIAQLEVALKTAIDAHDRNDETLERIYHRPSLQERHRAAGKALRSLRADDRAERKFASQRRPPQGKLSQRPRP